MFDNYNPYTLRMEISRDITRYYVSFMDGEGINRETEVSRPVYLEFLRFIRLERNIRRWDERHLEQSVLSDEALYMRALYPQKSVERTALDRMRDEYLRLTVQSLPEVQRRRFVLHHEFGLTFQQIAKMEGCSKVSVFRAIRRAEGNIRDKMKYF